MYNNPVENTNSVSEVRKPPSAVEVEKEVLGAMLLEKEAVPKAFEVLKAECFYDPKNEMIFEVITSLFESNEPIDTVTVFEELKKRGNIEAVGGAVYLSKLAQGTNSAANIDYHARIVLEKWILRQLIATSNEIAKSSYEGKSDVFDLLDEAEARVFKIAEQGLKESFTNMNKAVKEAIEYIEAIKANKLKNVSVKTGFYDLDEMLGGFQRSDLIIVAARPSMGKTAFALSALRNAAVDYKTSIAFFSLEMSTNQLVTRLISSEAQIDAHKLRTGKFKDEEGSRISRTAHKLAEAPIYIDDTPAQNVLQIRAKCRRLKAEKDLGLVIIDYMQLMNGSSSSMESREREISTISRSLKALAKELNIPVIALSQLNRAVESRQDKRPMLSDLRESGSIEQDADVVIFLYRPEAYGIMQDNEGNSTEGTAELIIGKQRNGPIGTVNMRFVKQFARYANFDVFHSEIAEESVTISPEDDLPI